MNVPDSKDYLEKILPGVDVKIFEFYKGKPNNRYEFSKPGIKPVATLIAQKLQVTSIFLDDLAVAVNKKLNDAPQVLAEEATTEAESEKAPEQNKEPDYGIQSRISREMYDAAKKVVEVYEREFPMT